MSARNLSVNDARCTRTGKQHGSEAIAVEASEAGTRWARDEAALALYGHGPATRAAFEALRAAHVRQREGRPEVVARKTRAVRERQQAVADARTWVDRVASAILTIARGDEKLAGRLAEAIPDDEGQLEGGLGTLGVMLGEVKDRLPGDFAATARLAEIPDLQSRLATVHGAVGTAKARRVADTAAIDLLDGRLYFMIRDLNAAARRAIRNGDLQAALAGYRFRHITKTTNGASPPAGPLGPTLGPTGPGRDPAPPVAPTPLAPIA